MRLAACAVVAAALSAAATVPSGPSDPAPLRIKGRDGMACFNCHSPDGIELSGFPKSDIVRRALGHLGQSDADHVADYLGSHATKLTPADPENLRPLQPGGAVLPGATPLERDAAFAENLAKLVPDLDGPPIRSTPDALRLRDHLLALDPRTVPIGIPLSHLSEDVYHGKPHATIADWFPDVGLPLNAHFVALENEYLASPDDASLQKLEAAVAALPVDTPIAQLAQAKFRCLLLLQNGIRADGGATPRLDQIKLVGPANPFWDVAEFGHHEESADADSIGIPDTVNAKKSGVPIAEQMKQLRLPWYWLGWTLDPSLTHMPSGLDRQGIRADYFTFYLWNDGPYPVHMAFMLAKKAVDTAYAEHVAPTGWPRHYEIQFTNLLKEDHLLKFVPTLDKDQEIRIFSNVLRSSVLMLEDDLKRTGACLRPEYQLFEIGEIRAYLQKTGNADDLAICDRTSELLKKAKVDGR